MARADLVAAAPPKGFGFAVSGSMTIPPPTPLIDTVGPFAVPPHTLSEWAADAPEGARCVYARLESLAAHARLQARSAELAAMGIIVLQGRARHAADSSLFDYIAKRTYAPMPAGEGEAEPPAATAADAAMETIFEALKADARRAARARSDGELALAAGLATRNMAAWRVRKLAHAGRIQIETLPGPDGPWRIVRVGKAVTAAPPALRQAQDRGKRA